LVLAYYVLFSTHLTNNRVRRSWGEVLAILIIPGRTADLQMFDLM